MPLEFKDERSHVGVEWCFSIGSQHEITEQLRVKEARILVPGLQTVAEVPCEDGDGDFLPDLETHLKVFGNLMEILSKLASGGGAVERGVVPDRAKERFAVVEVLAVFAQTFPRKSAFCVRVFVDLALPAFVGPGGGAKPNQGGPRHMTSVRFRDQFLNGFNLNLVGRAGP